MQQVLTGEWQIPVRWVENESRTTFENAQRSADILKRAGIQTIYLVTHHFHMGRSKEIFERYGLQVIPAPTALPSPRSITLLDFVPQAEALKNSSHIFHEWIGRLWYGLRFSLSRLAQLG